MIIINSIQCDITTYKVIDWLKCFDANYCLINENSNLELTEISNRHVAFLVNGKEIEINEKTTFWYRRGEITFDKSQFLNAVYVFENGEIIKRYLARENSKIREIINNYPYTNSIGSYYNNDLNKISVLNDAIKIGINVPDYIVTSKKEILRKFHAQHSKIITKSISDFPIIQTNKGNYIVYTSLVSKQDINNMGEHFYPSFFQKYIEKDVELRIFYLDNEFFACAIQSQLDIKTIVDFRNYNTRKPNRLEPFSLPKQIKEKLDNLMRMNNMRLGVIDMVYGKDKKFYFLEINPIGLFGNISKLGYYDIEKVIAEKLIKNVRN